MQRIPVMVRVYPPFADPLSRMIIPAIKRGLEARN